MEVEHPRAHPVAERQRRPEIGAGRRVDEPPRPLALAFERDVSGVIRRRAGFDDDDRRVWKRAAHGLLEIRERQRRAGVLGVVQDQARLRRERLIQLVAVDEDAARQRDDGDVESRDNARPEMNLEQRPAQEQ